MSHIHQEKRGVRIFISYKELERFDLHNKTPEFVRHLISRAKSVNHLRNSIKNLESQLAEIKENLQRFITLSSEVFAQLIHASSLDQFEIEKQKFRKSKNYELSKEQEVLTEISEDKEKNFDDLLGQLFPNKKTGVLKLMKRKD